MSSENTPQKINLILCDLPPGVTQSDIESFLSPYKTSIDTIQTTDKPPLKATITFKDSEMADKCRKELNQKKIKNKNIRIMREEKNFLLKNKEYKTNLYVKNIPNNKDARELYEYFLQFGDVFSLKVNENEKGDYPRTALLTYYKEEDAKKCIEETTNKKIWGSDMEVQYQKNNNEKGYNSHNNYHSGFNNNYINNRNLKINITNLPENYNEDEIIKLCEEFGKCEICDIKKNIRNGKFAIVKFKKESEAKNALEKLNNKEIGTNKLIVKELHSHNYNYPNYNNYNNRAGNFPLFYNFPMPKFEDPSYERCNLYVSNIPPNATKEDLEKTFGQYGTIKTIRLDEDKNITPELKEKVKFMNRGFGYVLYEKEEDAAKAIESLNGKCIIGFESYFKNLIVENFIPKEKRNNLQGANYYNMPSPPPIFYPGQIIPPSPYFMPVSIGINQIQNNQIRSPQYYPQGNYKNNYGYRRNNNRGRGGNRGGKNYQRRNNNNTTNIDKKEEEKKIEFDHDTFNKIETDEEKKDFLGEKLFNLIQENKLAKENNLDNETIGKITGMIIGIPNMEEIIDILENPSKLENRIKEALDLIEKSK